MGVKYSYDDFTTKGHGVIEGGWPKKKKTRKKKPKKKTAKTTTKTSQNKEPKRKSRHELYSEAYNNLLRVKNNAQKRRLQDQSKER